MRRVKKKIYVSLLEFKWVTDKTGQMYFDLLNQKIVTLNIYLFNPVIAIAIINLTDITDINEPLQNNDRDFVMIPINNSPVVQSVGKSGTHQSLMLFETRDFLEIFKKTRDILQY